MNASTSDGAGDFASHNENETVSHKVEDEELDALLEGKFLNQVCSGSFDIGLISWFVYFPRCAEGFWETCSTT